MSRSIILAIILLTGQRRVKKSTVTMPKLILMANGGGRGGRQRQTDEQYVERYVEGTYTPRTSSAWAAHRLAEEPCGRAIRRAVHRRHILWRAVLELFASGTWTGGTTRTSNCRAVIDDTYTDERYASGTSTGGTSRGSSTLSGTPSCSTRTRRLRSLMG